MSGVLVQGRTRCVRALVFASGCFRRPPSTVVPEGEKADCVAAVKKCGSAARDESPAAASQEVAGWWRSLKVALLLSIPIFVAKWGAMIGPGQEFWHVRCHRMTIEALVASVCGLSVPPVYGRFYRNATRNSESAGAWILCCSYFTVVTYPSIHS